MRRFLFWLPALLWAGLIFWFSAQSAPPDIGPQFPSKRKVEHMAGYAALGWLTMRALRKAHGLPSPKAAGLAIVLVAAYAASDEWHQKFVPGRNCEFSDVVIDTVGGSIAVACCLGFGSLGRIKASR